MKITIVLGAFFPVPPIMGGAIEKVNWALAKELVRRGHEVLLISRAIPQFPRSEVRDGVKYLRVPGFDMPRSLLWLKLLDLIYSIRVLRVLPPADIIVTHTFWLPMLLRDESRGRIYVHVGRYPKGQMRFYRHVARLQVMTEASARAIVAQVPDLQSKISVIPNPAPEPQTAGSPPFLEQREKVILFVGRVHPEKGVHLLVDAFASELRAFEDWKLVIVGPTEIKLGGGGDKYFAELKRRARDAAVVFRGPVFDATTLEQEFRSARIFVYPSLAERGETFGLSALEGMANGCAVFVSDLACFHDLVRDGETGFIFNHRARNPVEALRTKLEAAIVDPPLVERVARSGYNKSADYSISRVTGQFLADFDSLLGQSSPSIATCFSGMKITIVLGAFFPVPPIMGGAVEKVWFALGREFARRGHEVVLISRAHPDLPRTDQIDGVTHIRVSGFDQPRSIIWLKFLDLIYSLRVRRVLPMADILVTNTFWLPMLERGRGHGLVYIHVQRGPKGQMRFYSHVARLLAVSRAIAEGIISQAPELQAKVRVIPNPVPFKIDNEWTIARSNIILFVGRIHPEKGIELLLAAMQNLPDDILRKWKLRIVGPHQTRLGGGGDDFLRAMQRFDGSVEWLGPIFDDAQLRSQYDSASIFVYPSIAEQGEAFPVAPLEAMASGCVPLVSNLDCFRDYIEDDVTGFVFDHRSGEKALRDRLAYVLQLSREELLKISDAARAKAAELSTECVAERYLADFASLLAQP